MVNPTLQREFFTTGHNLFTILDGAAVPGLLVKLHRDEPEHVPLYLGELLPDRAETAPYLVRLERDSRFTQWLFDQGWGKNWGIFVSVSDKVDMQQMRKHFRTFLIVELDGQPDYFRYYDPRVLRNYLPMCNESETQTVFGPVIAYIVESREANTAYRFTVKKGLPYGEPVRLS